MKKRELTLKSGVLIDANIYYLCISTATNVNICEIAEKLYNYNQEGLVHYFQIKCKSAEQFTWDRCSGRITIVTLFEQFIKEYLEGCSDCALC